MNTISNPVTRRCFYAVTEDGWQLAVHEYAPRHQTIANPVLLVHGLGANRYNLDAPGRYSLAKYLARSGANCFVAELRGAGMSTRPRRGSSFGWNWTFDDYASKDLPAIMTTILSRTNANRLHWVGHSMGGMLGYACAGRWARDQISSLIAIGSPCFTQNSNLVFDFALYLRGVAKHLKTLPYEGLGVFLVPILPMFRSTAGRMLANPKNMDFLGLQGVLRKAPSTLSVSLMMQFAQWYEEGQATLKDGTRLTHLLTDVTASTMLVIGADDQLASVEDQRAILRLLPSRQKELLLLSEETGYAHDYGHVDPVLGTRAEYEVWPHFLRWIRSHDETSP